MSAVLLKVCVMLSLASVCAKTVSLDRDVTAAPPDTTSFHAANVRTHTHCDSLPVCL